MTCALWPNPKKNLRSKSRNEKAAGPTARALSGPRGATRRPPCLTEQPAACLTTFRRKIPFFGGGRNRRQKAKPAKLGLAGLRVDLG